jgi:CheY-like chemotaxis protein
VTRLAPAPLVKAAEFQLGQVFLNLIVNAAHAIPEGAVEQHTITVVSATRPDGAAVVEVTDDGAGIAPEHLLRIFEPFFTTKAVGEGTGLGLSLCHGIVTALGGRIEVESTPGHGSTFRVVLPPAALEPVEPPAQHRLPFAATPVPTGAHILVVDDEPLVGATIRRVLGGHEVEVLTSGLEALRRLRGPERFDLVLCDLMMPELSGMDLHATLADEAPELARRMVFITGGAFTERARLFLEQVPNARVPKPFSPQELRDVVRAALTQPA